MQLKEFIDLIDETAQNEGFENEFLIIVADEKGRTYQWTHVWNEHVKRSKAIGKIIRFLKRHSDFKNIY